MLAAQPQLTDYARRVSAGVLRGHVIMGAIQITVGCLLVYSNVYSFLSGDFTISARTFSGLWTCPIFIAAGATGLAGGRGRANTRCCLISCLVLSILAACFAVAAITANVYLWLYRYFFASYADILWLLSFVLELVVAIVQAAFACRATCCSRTTDVEQPGGGGGFDVRLPQLAESSATVETPPSYQQWQYPAAVPKPSA